MPERIQRLRTRGWRLPPNTVCVSRPSIMGNPFLEQGWGRELVCRLYREAGTGSWNPSLFKELSDAQFHDAYAIRSQWLEWFRGKTNQTPQEYARVFLVGKKVACWCRLDQVCHGDVILEWANSQ